MALALEILSTLVILLGFLSFWWFSSFPIGIAVIGGGLLMLVLSLILDELKKINRKL